MENFIWNQYTERLAMLKTKNIKICGRIKKLKAYQQKFEFIFSQGSVAKCQRWDGYCRMGFVPNFIRFPTVQKFWKSVKIWQSYRTFKGRSFFETQCILYHKMSLRPPPWNRLVKNRSESCGDFQIVIISSVKICKQCLQTASASGLCPWTLLWDGRFPGPNW